MSSQSSLQGISILLVEDDRDTLLGMKIFLQRKTGAQVHTATCVREALTILSQLKVDLLISDIGMPDEDGYSLMTKMRTMGNHTPAIALTAHVGSEDKARAAAAGFNAHVPKPVDLKKLLETITRLAEPKPQSISD